MSDAMAYCEAILPKVSRTFAEPIAQLPDGMRRAAMMAYLMCRTADTVEDHPTLDPAEKEELLRLFADVTAGDEDPRVFDSAFAIVEPGGGPDAELSRHYSVVMKALDEIDPASALACRRWARELSMGMNIYVQRPPGPDGLRMPFDLADLERYCYFVAGTVGYLLADLLRAEVPAAHDPSGGALSCGYGLALQLVNILKDVGEDLERDVAYIPRSILTETGVRLRELGRESERARLRRGLRPVFERARDLFREKAVPYCLSIPEEHHDIRVAFLLPVFLAIPTLGALEASPQYLVPGEKVRLSRLQVLSLVRDCKQLARQNRLVLDWMHRELSPVPAARAVP